MDTEASCACRFPDGTQQQVSLLSSKERLVLVWCVPKSTSDSAVSNDMRCCRSVVETVCRITKEQE